jgi:hypothetical protein
MLRMRRIWAILPLLLLSACAEVWTRPGTPEAVAEATQAVCRDQAALAVPPHMVWVMVRPAGYFPENRCWRGRDGREVCRTFSRWRPADYDLVDVNERPRDAWRRQCLSAQGFTFQGYRALRLE